MMTPISFRDFSIYRNSLMGVAILFIMASHSLGRFALYGNIGVEWFLILSAIGQFFSLKRDDNTWSYYKRKINRILPAYLFVAIPFFLFRYPFSISDYIIRLTGLNLVFFWERTFWFVSLICICYLIAPFYYSIIERYKTSIMIPFVLVTITFILSFHMPRTQILITRIPIFLLGMNFGKFVYEEKQIVGGKACLACFVLSFLSMAMVVLINYIGVRVEYHRFTYFFCGIPSLFFILEIVKQLGFLKSPLSFVGSISYEIYLLHESIVLALCLKLTLPKIVSVLISYVLVICIAYLLHKAIGAAMKAIQRWYQLQIK